MTENRSII